MALALYRKYRPAAFAEVVGQEHVTEPLRTALAAGRINHAYLFSGPRGCGKTSSARIMARSLNCVEGPTPDPCGKCDSCRALAPEGSGSVDVTELDAASHGGVDDARELRDRAFYAPAEARYRVFIIDEAHMVTTQGFNALLKIVEEPPEHLIFIFATTEPDKVLPTIRSRTHHYPFRLIPPSAMRELLERNVEAEGVAVEPAVFPLVIRAGGGSARDTQSVLDQLLAGAGPDGVAYDRAVSLLGVTDVALIDDMVDGLAEDDASAVFGTVERLAEAGHDPRRFATDLLDRLRDLVLLRSVPDAGARGLVAAPEEELNRMVAQAERLGAGTLTRYAEIINTGLLEMRGATAPRLLLELLCARMLLPSPTEGEAALLQRLERLERRVTVGGSAPVGDTAPAADTATYQRPSQRAPQDAPQARPEPARQEAVRPEPARPEPVPETPARPVEPVVAQAEPAVPEPAPSATPTGEPAAPGEQPAGGLDAVAIRRVWPQLLAAIRKVPGQRSTEAMLTQAGVHSVDGSQVTLTHSAEPLARRLSETHNAEKIAAALHEVLGGQWQVRCVHGAPGAAAAPAARPAPQAPAQQRPDRSDRQERQRPAEGASRSYRRPSEGQEAAEQPRQQAPRRPAPVTSEPDIPLPPEPEDEEPPPHTAEDTGPPAPGSPAPRSDSPLDAEAAAHKLLSDHLGARPLD
ncbi:DNA polymerase III subunit gamma/tau [Amycolatopsis antarctica]|uniref:DNA polymerase III subunit gamma/tau n=1 Tax=Amycolatopsis antarctica TaxID=1854586 RepID=A0A263D4B9_9PSEU|nr:DNA polymerase III subunit gamma and tau [Amycolatopsis antarctica]OZM73334.1 DNA polymerase III subunit gamma/tau [Amycolatopsis antarctica]